MRKQLEDVFVELLFNFVIQELLDLEVTQQDTNLLPCADMYFGPKVAKVIPKGTCTELCEHEQCKAGLLYVETTKYLQKKLPVNNALLQWVSTLNPLARGPFYVSEERRRSYLTRVTNYTCLP